MIKTLNEMLERAKMGEPCRLAVAAAQDEAVLQAVYSAKQYGIIKPLLVGDKNEICNIALKYKIPLREEEIVDVSDKAEACMKAALFVRDGQADLLMKGFVDTSVVMKAVLNEDNRLRKSSLISHVAVLEIPGFDRLFYVTDSAMNIAPDVNQKEAILNNAAEVAHALDNPEPKAAVLCGIEKVNSKMPCTVDAEELKKRYIDGRIKGCVVDGPLALDNAVSVEAARHKGIGGAVAGQADILLVPDLEAGNILNKSMEYFAHACKAGVMMGAKVPIILISRASSSESKMYSIALGALVARRR